MYTINNNMLKIVGFGIYSTISHLVNWKALFMNALLGRTDSDNNWYYNELKRNLMPI